jgi:hypothetical protein
MADKYVHLKDHLMRIEIGFANRQVTNYVTRPIMIKDVRGFEISL